MQGDQLKRLHLGLCLLVATMAALSLAFSSNVLDKRNKYCEQEDLKDLVTCKTYGKDFTDGENISMSQRIWGSVIVTVVFSIFSLISVTVVLFKHSNEEYPFVKIAHIIIIISNIILVLVSIIYQGSQHKDGEDLLIKLRDASELEFMECEKVTPGDCYSNRIATAFASSYLLYHRATLAVNIILLLLSIVLYIVGSKVPDNINGNKFEQIEKEKAK